MSIKKNKPTPEEEIPETSETPETAAGREDPGAPNETAAAPESPETDSATEAPNADAPSPDALLKAEKDKYLRLMAEYDNYRKRSVKERECIFGDVRADTVTKFLPVYDNLVRALAQSTEDEAYRKGVEMIMTQFNEVLKSMGVSEIEAVGKTFDPALHNAVMHEDDPEKGENEIVMELQKGFKMGDKVIRFSMVKTVN